MILFENYKNAFDLEFNNNYKDKIHHLSHFHYVRVLFLMIMIHFIDLETEDLDNKNQIEDIYINYLIYYFKYQNFDSTEFDIFQDDIYQLEIVKNMIEHYYLCIQDKLNEYHFDCILPEFTRINSIIVPEQRTPGWFAQRLGLISASEAMKAIKTTAPSGRNNLILSKLGFSGPRARGEAIEHGVVFEIVSQVMYELRNNISIREYGCLPHSNYNFIGASPDGIVSLSLNDDNLMSRMYVGRMLEIKNPKSRHIFDSYEFEFDQIKLKKIIPEGYYCQIQLQLEVCSLFYCDFLETKIIYYNTFLEFSEDKFVLDENNVPKNKNIPLTNLCSTGMEKGVIIKVIDFSKEETKISSILYPLTSIYTIEKINLWVKEQENLYKGKINSVNFEFKVIYWKCENYQVKTVERDQYFIDNKIIPPLKKCWEEIEADRKLSQIELVDKYKKILELVPDEEFKIDPITNHRPNKIRRIIKNPTSNIKMIFKHND